jgi:hypothetical protein
MSRFDIATYRINTNIQQYMLSANSQKINKGEYHIHVDAVNLAPTSEDTLLKYFGFSNTAFSGHAEGALHFETPKHFTFKTQDIKEFNHKFDTVEQYFIDNVGSIIGYLEGEYIPLDLDLEDRAFDPSVPMPFQLQLTKLDRGSFREDEIHITLDRDRSNPQLLENLRSMGFFSAYMDKPQGNVEIFTTQGTKKTIRTILTKIKDYLNQAGGMVNCSIKEEIILKWWLSDLNISVPPVVGLID